MKLEINILGEALEKLGRHFLFSRKKILSSARDTLRNLESKIAEQQKDKETIGVLHSGIREKELWLTELQNDKETITREIGILRNSIQEKDLRLTELQNAKETMIGEIDVLQDSIREKDLQLRNFSLVSNALGADTAKNVYIQEFRDLVRKDFREFCDYEAAINDTVAYQEFQQILAEMQRFSICPALHSKTIGAIGGGFSSGKSAFVNSLIDKKAGVRLAEGIRPVTAIPSYVLHDAEARIHGVNNKGGLFDIELEMYREISHELLKSLSFNLKEIVPYVIVSAPMQAEHFSHLCFIDTPGYNPSGVGFSENDLETAREYIRDARFLIWMIGLDANGTIPQSDLEFLNKLEFGKTEERLLYVVASKADSKSTDDIEDILDIFEDCLNDHDLQCAGISAYSAKNEKIYAVRGQGLFEFLAENNRPREHHSYLIDTLCNALRPYVEEIYRDDHQKSQYRKSIRDLLMEGLKTGITDVENSENQLEQGLCNLEKHFTHAESLEIRLKRLQDLCDKFFSCLDGFCDKVGMEKTDTQKQRKKLFRKPAMSFLQSFLTHLLDF